MDIKVMLCNCKGLCDSFRAADMNTLPFAVESSLDVKYCVLHPQLCGQGGNAVLADALKTADANTWFVVGACAPETQRKLFKKLLRQAGFDERRLVSVDIRGIDNEGIEKRLKEAVEGILNRAGEASQTAVAS